MEWFREVLESLPDATVVIDEDGRIVFLNPQTETLFGYSRDELLGQSIEQLVPPSFREKHAGHRSGYFSTPLQRSNGSNIEFYGLRKDGTDFPIEVSFGSIRGDQGSFVTEIIRDVTCRKGWEKEHQLQLLSTGDVIEAVAQPKTDFLANIAHRMRTPLNAIIGTSELLTLTDMTPQQRRQSVIIQSSGELLLSIINDILDFLKFLHTSWYWKRLISIS